MRGRKTCDGGNQSRPLLTDLSLAMRTNPLALIREATELVTVKYGPAVTFGFPDVKAVAYRSSVLHLNLISAVDGSALNWCEQHVLRELLSEDLLFAKISEPEMTVVNFDDHFRDRMGEVDRGHIEVFPKFWNLRPYDKINGRDHKNSSTHRGIPQGERRDESLG